MIKETKLGKKEGTVWAVATAADGSEMKCSFAQKTGAKNGGDKALTEAEGKQVKVRYHSLGRDKIFAVKVEIARKSPG